ncbi:MAG: acetyl-CoA carboxylase biotin carboxyl carrier protein [Chloroflexi bacterium]|nr:acetyl-CoA carboxylase biotin carboxyl carrier protein [Chloroflexota bacterium]
MELTQDEVLQIVKLVEESAFDELQLEMEGMKLVVRRGGVVAPAGEVEAVAATPRDPAPAAKPAVAAKQEKAVLQAPPAPKAGSPSGAATPSVATALEPGQVAIKAPTVGTFYRAPKPGAPPFVQVGSYVTEDDTVCILEVMKCFISVKAGARGYITRISAENEQLVEFGQELFVIKVGEKVATAAP